MQTGTLKIRIGASLDRSVESTFGAIEARSKKAATVVQRNLNSGFGKGGPYRSRPVNDTYAREARAAEDSARRQTRAVSESTKEQIRFFRQLGKVAEQELNKRARAVQREAEQESRARVQAQERFARRTSYRATRFLFPPPMGILGAARRMGSDMLSGAGINFNFGAMVARNVELQRAAVALSNQGYQPGASGAAGQRVSAGALEKEARGVAGTYGIDPAEVMKAHEAFVSLTGDLDTSRKSMGDMAKLSAATGANIVDMAQAQASVSLALGDTTNKSQKIEAIMRTIAGQGKIGAVEIKDLAKGMAGLAAQAPAFAGSVEENIGKLGALAQLARGTGGAKSAAQAVTSVERFVSTLQTPARVKAFKAAGIQVYNKEGKIRDPFELIKESLVTTKGDPVQMAKLFQSVMGQRGVRSFTNAYNAAGGGAKGLQAVQALLDKFTKGATMSKGAVTENAALAANSDAARAQRFQNELDKIAASMQSKLLPAVEQLAPYALKAADGLAKLVSWAAANPGKAIVAAIVASIARAGIESAARGALEGMIKRYFQSGGSIPGVPGGGVPVPGGKGGGGGLGATMGGLSVVALAGATLGLGANAVRDATGMKRSAAGFMVGFNGQGDFSAIDAAKDTFNPLRMLSKSAAFGGEIGRRAANWMHGKGFTDTEMMKGAPSIARASGGTITAADLGQSVGQGVANAIAGRELRVRVTNPDEMKQTSGASVDPSGRTPPPGKPKK